MAQIHELESKSRFGTRYIVGIILAISTLLVAGWIGFFVFLPIKSGMSTIYEPVSYTHLRAHETG